MATVTNPFLRKYVLLRIRKLLRSFLMTAPKGDFLIFKTPPPPANNTATATGLASAGDMTRIRTVSPRDLMSTMPSAAALNDVSASHSPTNNMPERNTGPP